MDSKKGKFTYKGLSTPIFEIFKFKGIAQGKNINIAISFYSKDKYDNIDVSNQLSIWVKCNWKELRQETN